MPVKENLGECFGEVVGSAHSGINAFKVNQIAFDPFTECEVLYVDMACAASWFLRIAHCGTAVVILVCDGSGFLWYVEVPQDTADEEAHAADVAGSHELGFG